MGISNLFRKNKKKLYAIGIIILLLVFLVGAVFLSQKKQETRSHASLATALYLSPSAPASAPSQIAVGDTVSYDVMLSPGAHLPSLVKLEIDYDTTKFHAGPKAFTVNTAAFPQTLEGPAVINGAVLVAVSVGLDVTKAITTTTKVGTLTLTAVSPTSSTMISFGNRSQVYSLSTTDSATDNVLTTTTPNYITIQSTQQPTNTPTPTPTRPTSTPTPTLIPTATPTLTATPTRLGLMNLWGYCQSKNAGGSQLVGSTWLCGNGTTIDLNDACQWQYANPNAYAKQEVVNNPYSWVCYVGGGVTPPPPPTRLGLMDLWGYCQNRNAGGSQLVGSAWTCTNGTIIDLSAACQWQYRQSGAYPKQEIANNPFSWACYTGGTVPGRVGIMDLTGYCQSRNAGSSQLLSGQTWACTNGTVIDLNGACQWQYANFNAYAKQEIVNNPLSWACYAPATSVLRASTIRGDTNNDNTVNVLDYNILTACYKEASSCTGAEKAQADLNNDGVVNQNDYNLFLQYLRSQKAT